MDKNIKFLQQAVCCLLGLGAVLWLESFTSLDIWLEDMFFLPDSGTWLISREFHTKWGILLYALPKLLIIAFGVFNLCFLAYSWKTGKYVGWRKNALKIILALALIPATVGGLKAVTNVYCPYQIERYGGPYPYAPALKHYPQNFTQTDIGRGFPAGHASGGLALMALYFCFTKHTHRRLVLLGGLGVGWYMGIYQMLRGEHFLSHTLFSTILAWFIILAIARFVEEPMLLPRWHKKFAMPDLPKEPLEN